MNIEWAKKQAKRLKRLAISEDAEACARIRKVYSSKYGEASTDAIADEFCHMQALHVIAVEQGFRCWADAVRQNGGAP